MHVSHLTFAAGPDGLLSEVARLEELLQANFRDGGFHPRFGTRNHILPLAEGRYIEVVEALDHPAAEKAAFGQAVRRRSQMGGGWLGWVVSVADLSPYESRLERQAVPGSRTFPDGRLLEWEQIGVRGLMSDSQLPYFIKWTSDESVLPSALGGDIEIKKIEVCGPKARIENWLGVELGDYVDGVRMTFLSPYGMPGIQAVTFKTPEGNAIRI